MEEGNRLENNIAAYKRKYHLFFLLKGLTITVTLVVSLFLFYNLLEYFARFPSVVRAILFYSYLLIALIAFGRWVILPLLGVFLQTFQISNEEAARRIGLFFPGINDKLLNILQLYRDDPDRSDLVSASIEQKSKEVGTFRFEQAVNLYETKQFIFYLLIPFVVIIFLGVTFPRVLSDGTTRIVNYNVDFKPMAPFRFNLLNDELIAYKNEDYSIDFEVVGEEVPESVYILFGDRRIKINSPDNSHYRYQLKKIADDVNFQLEGAGFFSDNFKINVVNRPNIRNFNVSLQYPAYLNRKNEKYVNTGNLQVPEGTNIQWQLQTLFTDSLKMRFMDDSVLHPIPRLNDQLFEYERSVKNSTSYELVLNNDFGPNKEPIIYQIEVLEDQYPRISINQYGDSVLYNYVILGGNISDDYGFSSLKIFYKVSTGNTIQPSDIYQSENIAFDPNKNTQGFYYQWNIDSLHLSHDDQVEYFLEVRDNDGINGRKRSRTSMYYYRFPARQEIREELEKSSQAAENQLDRALKDAQELNEKIEEAQDRLKGKRQMSWQDQKLLEDIIKDKKDLVDEVEKLKELNESLNQKQDKFGNQSEKMKEKVEQLQKLMDELLDEETKKLYEELQKLLEEKKDLNEIKSLMENIDFNEQNFEEELERMLELFKKLKFEMDLDQTINELNDLQEKQENLSEQTENKENELGDIQDEQESLNKEFNEIEESIEDLLDQNQDLKHPNPMQDTFEDEKNIKESQKDASDNLEQGKRNKAAKSQQNASEKMKSLSEKMQQMQSSGQMMEMQENLKSLRDIVDNLIKLSQDQEKIMDEFKVINQSDPRFIELSQQQLKLKDDAKVIQDSLIALSQRVMQISSFITREVNEMNKYMDESMEDIRDRKKAQASGKQQFAMTSMNNLALLLDDVLTSMQQALANAMGIPSKDKKSGQKPSMSKMQQMLNEQIQELKKSGKSGKALSEELSKLAAEQEKIRRMLQEEEEKLNDINGNDGNLGDLVDKMEQTEIDLVNKRITERLIQRQEDILTRLLEAEDAMREQELDKDREAKTARQLEREIPPEFEEYLRSKEKEIELLKTVPPKLNPYYKKEAMDYFKRLENTYN